MKRTLMLLAVMVIATGCAMWQKAPLDDPATPQDEAADHAAKVEAEEDQVRAGSAVVQALVPLPFSWIIPLLTQGLLGAAAMRRQ